jgi:hypothetical protein
MIEAIVRDGGALNCGIVFYCSMCTMIYVTSRDCSSSTYGWTLPGCIVKQAAGNLGLGAYCDACCHACALAWIAPCSAMNACRPCHPLCKGSHGLYPQPNAHTPPPSPVEGGGAINGCTNMHEMSTS